MASTTERTIQQRAHGRKKWNVKMNCDLLECKQKAVLLAKSENPPRLDNGRKKGVHADNERSLGGERVRRPGFY